ncbi:MAG: TIGR01777 family protein [Bdellovibrionaceae bacterium]|nr:TIGR01777 family protein [Pseudobdellovibrionaceae bacterium]|tara:strand:- start:1473 stop:2825 length:1353 start_codon:yes stop_codon:yes gene_type:complete
MKILVTGATGWIGKTLVERLFRLGHEIVVISRNPDTVEEKLGIPVFALSWKELNKIPSDIQCVYHLAGETIAQFPWTKKIKKSIYDSRVSKTKNLTRSLSHCSLDFFLSTSAIGVFGERGDEELNENSLPGEGFLSEVCVDWEDAASYVTSFVNRLLIYRIGVVLGEGGGMLERLYPLAQKGVLSSLGEGKGWMSWIAKEDLIHAMIAPLEKKEMEGVYHLVSPHPVRQKELYKELAKRFGKGLLPSVPFCIPQFFTGGAMKELLASQKVRTSRLIQSGFKFKYEQVGGLFESLLFLKSNERLFESTQWINAPIENVFEFFSSEKNLEKITPDFLNFRVEKKSTPKLEEGTVIDYRLKIHGVPARWKTLISRWVPGELFEDVQIKGPYKKWQHLHTFDSVQGGTLIKDKVVYQVPLGMLGNMVAGRFIRSDVSRIFKYRTQTIDRHFHQK